MSCENLQYRLQDFLDGKLSNPECRAAEAHLAGCPECRELVSLLRLAGPEFGVPDLASSILERTTGPACGRAREILCDYVDSALGTVDAALLEAHGKSCPDCAALERALERLATDLPAMAELRPGADLLPGILAATTGRRRRRAELVERLERGWAALLARPRLAWEAGYVGAMGVWLAVGLLGASFEASASLPTSASARVVERMHSGVETVGRNAWGETGGRGIEAWRGLMSQLAERYRRALPALDDLRRDGGRLEQAAIRLDLGESGDALEALAGGARTVWKRFTTNANDEDGASPRGD